ncbi:MAG: hypothetical protein K2P94_13655 [Rhodospirillaceae bacterium]|nr:hypothetical protein [Rhodospirillaceae bacterium]
MKNMVTVSAAKAKRGAGILGGALLAASLSTAPAQASETRGYVVSWFFYATYADESHCPKGLNPSSEMVFRRILKEAGTPQDKIEKALDDFPNSMYFMAGRRGKIDGKPVDVYLNPTSVADPELMLAQGTKGLGFNLDGKTSPLDFIDSETGEKGVDNRLFRAFGCIGSLRGKPTAKPTHPSIQWDMTRDQMQAWVIEISGIDDLQNDDDVQVTINRAIEPVVRNAAAEPQTDMTFRVDANPRINNVARAKIKDGVLTTEPFDFYMIGDPFSLPEYELRNARLRFKFGADGSLQGLIGGYQPWEMIYWSFASGGSVNEANVSVDIPGIYYALRKMADAYPDPKSGINTAISTSYIIDAVPAFIEHPAKQTAAAK